MEGVELPPRLLGMYTLRITTPSGTTVLTQHRIQADVPAMHERVKLIDTGSTGVVTGIDRELSLAEGVEREVIVTVLLDPGQSTIIRSLREGGDLG